MSNKIQLKVEELNGMTPTQIVENQVVESKFVAMYNAIWGVDKGSSIYEKEKFNFLKLLQENPDLSNCTRISLYGCFLDMAVNGLSLDPTGKPHCYLIPRSVKSGHKDSKGKDIHEKRATVNITGYGELTMRMRAGQIKYADNPVVVYQGDIFKAELQGGKKVITYAASVPRKTNKIIGAFIRIVRLDGSEDYQWLLEGDIDRLKHYSEKNNSYFDVNTRQRVLGDANKLYTSNAGGIDPGFLENKMIKHAFDAYPKVRTGNYTIMETMEDPRNEIDYGIEYGEAEDITGHAPAGFGDENITPSTPQPETVINTTEEDDDAGF
ncbi:MAG: recombinase RecT [Tannerella sp.]|jgi:recombinational DNA repair protein RecT|nr:recombinase RecT [Tannerella sp.]